MHLLWTDSIVRQKFHAMEPIWTETPRRGGWIGFAARLLVILAFWAPLPAGTAAGLYLLSLASEVPQLPDLNLLQPVHSSRIVLMDGTKLAGTDTVGPVPFDELPPHVIAAFLAAEDEDFFAHDAFSVRSIARAAWENWRAGQTVQGASTITQQVARRFLTNEKTYARKIQELLIARRIEASYRKDEILDAYLRSVFLGHRADGVTNASWTYFGKDPRELSTAEAATLAGILPAPSAYNPIKSIENATRERNRVLRRMAETGMISEAERDAWSQTPIRLGEPSESIPAFAGMESTALRMLKDRYGDDAWATRGMTVVMPQLASTSMRATQALMKGVEELDHRQGFTGPLAHAVDVEALDKELLAQTGRLQLGRVVEVGRDELVVQTSAVVTLKRNAHLWASPAAKARHFKRPVKLGSWNEILKVGDIIGVRMAEEPQLWQPTDFEGVVFLQDAVTGHVLATAGSAHPGDTFDRAWQACRQPGSVFKPIVYAEALSRGMTAATMVSDVPVEVDLGHRKVWTPKNADRDFKGYLTLANALAWSRNLPTIHLAQHMGAPAIVARARKLGVESVLDPTTSMALGASCLKPYELARVYSAFQRSGRRVDAHEVAWVERPDGTIDYDQLSFASPDPNFAHRLDRMATVEPRDEPALSPNVAFIMLDLLRRVVTSGTAHDLPNDWLVAGKTGTTNEFDAWFVGIDGRYTTVVWVGADQNQRPLGAGEHGATAALPVFESFFAPIVQHAQGDATFPRDPPPGIEYRDIDANTGLLTPEGEWGIPYPFVVGTAPRETSPSLGTRQAQEVDSLMYEF